MMTLRFGHFLVADGRSSAHAHRTASAAIVVSRSAMMQCRHNAPVLLSIDGTLRGGRARPKTRASPSSADLVEVNEQVRGILVDADRSRLAELSRSVATAEHPDSKGPAAGGVPDFLCSSGD